MDKLNSGRSGPLRGLDRSVAPLAEILEVSTEPATRAELAKLEQRELNRFVDCYLLQDFGYQIEGWGREAWLHRRAQFIAKVSVWMAPRLGLQLM